jgi:predicted HTH domain antitoxin
MEAELRRRLAAALFSDGIISGAAACRMAGMDKAEFQFMLGERGQRQPLTETFRETAIPFGISMLSLAHPASGWRAW